MSSQILYDRLCKLYSLCVQRLTINSDTVKVAEELSINLYRLRTQGAEYALKLVAKANTIENKFRSSEAETEEIEKETTTGYELR